ncbi:hypothetical protein ACGFI9_18700 [Micromonospora sp. NPDC048930]
MSDEEWKEAMLFFYSARVEHYTDRETGQIVLEPHDEDGEPSGVGL